MIRTYLATAATALVLGTAMFAGWGIAASSEASAQGWRYERPYDHRYDRRRYNRERDYRRARPYYQGGPRQGFNQPAPPAGLGRSGVLPNGRSYYTPPGGQLPPGQSYNTAPGRNGPGGNN